MSAYDPGAALSPSSRALEPLNTLDFRFVTALQSGTGVTVLSTSDLVDNIELSVQFTTTTNVSVPLDRFTASHCWTRRR